MLRIVLLTDETRSAYWDKYRNLPFMWNNEKTLRYYATNQDEINKVTGFLKEEFNYRKSFNNKEVNYTSFLPYYLIIADDVNLVKNNILVKEILETKQNYGYSVVMLSEKLDLLPNECATFVNVDPTSSGVFTNEMTQNNQLVFTPDFVDFDIKKSISKVSNVPLDIANGKFILPQKYSFLEMYDVGNVNQLNVLNRWKTSDVVNTLEAPVGIDESAQLFKIDLHEKAHGPHGLVAGMTGSGKSEWIITYILSMAVNYSPEEVQFVLIDYKGGGLALTFDDQENGIKLPHVVGTITNLDIVEIKRSLASIESELKRRQTMFKKAREVLNESSMDIYKYQKLYREGKVEEPMSHLFIISDEFAELKAQQPEFMEQLISTARIGRSLGVHLILATQKPSGVVDDQIWSNSKFRVCLKVQDKSDSNDMLKCPDAAMLKETGRFYFQVGYNELFAKGQSAYAGCPYYESDKRIEMVDSTLDFVDNIGATIKRGDIKKNNANSVFKGEELPNILNYIIDTYNTGNFNVKSLWLNSIPKQIFVDKLSKKYNYSKEDYVLNPIIGEYDNPSKQVQGVLTLELSKLGNTLLYGMSGSGKENFLSTMLYSLISNYNVDECNCYILDFGSQILNNFKEAPQIGDIMHSGDDEKIENLFKFISKEIKKRRNLFLNTNGNYLDYIKMSNNKLPNIVVIINSFEIFSELYESYVDSLIKLSRDSVRYGIYFVITCMAASSVKLKLSQNFKNVFCLQLSDEYDYRSILGNTNGIVPSKNIGRGLVKLDSVVEFQTAYAFEAETLYEEINKYCYLLKQNCKDYAKEISVLPDIVKTKDILLESINISNIPIGIKKNNLEIAKLDLSVTQNIVIAANNISMFNNFIDSLLCEINSSTNFRTILLDMNYLYEENIYNNIIYLNSNSSDILNKLNNREKDVLEILKNNNFKKQTVANVPDFLLVIIGLNKFIKSLSSEDKMVFENLLNVIKNTKKTHLLFVDSANELKKNEYELWYKDSVDSSTGLWLGDGFSDQTIVKPNKYLADHSKLVGNSFGYLVTNGNAEFVKIVEEKSN